MPARLAILGSGAGTTAEALIVACRDGRIAMEPVLVIGNNSGAGIFARAAAHGVPAIHLSSRTHPDPLELDTAMVAVLRDASVTDIALAGYLRKLGPAVLGAYAGRLLNTHPALLPAHGGQGMYGDRVHAAVLASGDRISGATAHEVTSDYDAGPIVARSVVPVLADDDVATLGARVRAAERELLIGVLAERARRIER